MKTVLYWLVTLPLSMISATVLGVYSFLCLAGPGRVLPGLVALFVLLTGTAILVLPWIIKKDRIRRTLLLLRIPLTLAMAGFAVFLLIDTAPPANDYTERDIIPDTPEVRECFQTIKPMLDDYQKKIEIDRSVWMSEDFLSHIDDHATEVTEAWEAISEEREIIEKLDGFDRIIAVDPDEILTYEAPFVSISGLFDSQAIYLAKAVLDITSGKSGEALDRLAQLNNVARKGAKSSVILIHKILWTALISRIEEGIYIISRLDFVDMTTKQMLKKRFTPLVEEDIKMTQTIIGEYLFGKSYISEYINSDNFLSSFNSFGIPCQEPEGLSKYLSRVVYAFGFKKNKALREFKTYMDLLISASNQIPSDLSAADRMEEEFIHSPDLRNLAGWIISSQNESNYGIYFDRVCTFKTKTDLLSIHLHEITGESLELNDIYTGKPYVLRSENGVLSTPGKDGVFDTEDDVSLGFKKESEAVKDQNGS